MLSLPTPTPTPGREKLSHDGCHKPALIAVHAEQPHARTVEQRERGRDSGDAEVRRRIDVNREQHRRDKRQEHGREQVEDVLPEHRDVQADALVVVPVHERDVADERGDGRADGGAEPLPLPAKGDADEDVPDQNGQIQK